jgi:hypothetical protein
LVPQDDDPIDDELISSIADGTCVLFVGAGFTNAFSQIGGERVKNASALGAEIIRSLNGGQGVSADQAERIIAATSTPGEGGSDNYQLRLAAQFYISERVRWDAVDPEQAREDLIEILVRETGQTFSKETLDAAAPLLTLPWSSIYTTNYDSLVEATLSSCDIRYQVTTRPSDLVDRVGDRLEVVKIHGSIDEVHLDAELPLVVTSDDYANFGWTRGLLLDELRVNLAQRDVLFLGYGLQDENLDTVIREVSRAISRTPRSLYVHTRGTAEEPWWNYLRFRNFKVRRSQDLVALAGRLTAALSDFRTSHDGGYVEYAITSRDQSDDPYDAGKLMAVRAAVARQTWQSSRTHGTTVHLAGCGDDVVAALFFFLKAKDVEAPDGSKDAKDRRADAVREWLKDFAAGNPTSRNNWHRTLECLALAAHSFDDSHVRSIVDLLRTNVVHHPDTLSRWLVLQLIRELQMKTPSSVLTSLRSYILNDGRVWRTDVDSDASAAYRPVVPRLAWSIFRTNEYREFLTPSDQRTWGDVLLSWELSKLCEQPIVLSRESATSFRLGDGVRLDRDLIRGLFGSRGGLAVDLMADPLARRASLRAAVDQAQAGNLRSPETAGTAELFEFLGDELSTIDRRESVVEPFFGSFVLLELAAALRSDPATDIGHLAVAHRHLMAAGTEAVELIEHGDPTVRSRAGHFAAAMCRDLLYGARTLEQHGEMQGDDGESFVELTTKIADLSVSNQWMVENLLNVSVHLARLPDPTPQVQRLLDRILAHARRDDVWPSLSPLLRYYVTKSLNQGGRRSHG